jgi:cell division protein FtsL
MNSRLNLILVVVALVCALSIVAANHRARQLFIELEREQTRMHALDVEWGQLQLEQSTWANHARVEKIAREKLQMRTPPAGQVISLEGGKS